MDNANDPLTYNTGDYDLAQYLRPMLKNIGYKMYILDRFQL